MSYPENFRFSPDHEWVVVEDAIATIGITDFAQHQLGDIVFVDLPAEGDEFEAGDTFGEVESVKSVSELITPVSGRVIEVNPELDGSPETVNSDPHGDGWMMKVLVSNTDELDSLLDIDAYNALIGG